MVVKNLFANAGEARYLDSINGSEDSLEKEMATHSSVLAWTIPMDRGAWRGYSSRGYKESDTNERLHFFTPFILSAEAEAPKLGPPDAKS